MMRKLVSGICVLLVLAACGRKEEMAAAPMLAAAPAVEMARKLEAPQTDAGQPASVPRHIELRHNVVIEVAEDRLEALWRAQLEACQLPACEVVAAGIANQRGDMASANLALRIVPGRAGELLATLRGLGKLAQHEMSQNDRTHEVVDLQARLANQKALRDRLRGLLAGRVDKVRDLLEVERELARVQGEIDSLEGQMRATLGVTEKVSFDIQFRAPASLSQPGSWEPLREAWRRLGSTFAESLAMLMYFLVGGLPWFAVGAAVLWGGRRLWRARKSGPKS